MSTKTIAPIAEGMTTAQAGRASDRFLDKCRKEGKIFPKDTVQIVLEQEGDEVAQEMFDVIRQRVEAKLVLIPRGTASVTLVEDHDPDTFYKTRQGLWVDSDFCSRVVVKAKGSKTGATHEVTYGELAKDLNDTEIESALPARHLLDETQVSAVVAGLISKQANGEEGTLLNNGRVNLFYTSSCVVDVYWSAVDRDWYVSAWLRHGSRWDAGLRVFFPATAA